MSVESLDQAEIVDDSGIEDGMLLVSKLSPASVEEFAQSNITIVSVTSDYSSVEDVVREYFSDLPVMIQVARCESTFNQFDRSGNPLRGVVNNSDVGVMQINEFYHLETAKRLGHDIHTIEGNLAYARNLYEREGVRPWQASRPCWGGYAGELAAN